MVVADTPNRFQHDQLEDLEGRLVRQVLDMEEAADSAAASEVVSEEDEVAEASIVASIDLAVAVVEATAAIEVATVELDTEEDFLRAHPPDLAEVAVGMAEEVVDMEAGTTAILHARIAAETVVATETAIANETLTAKDLTRAVTTNHDKGGDTEGLSGFVAWWYTPFHFATCISLSPRDTTTVSVSYRPKSSNRAGVIWETCSRHRRTHGQRDFSRYRLSRRALSCLA